MPTVNRTVIDLSHFNAVTSWVQIKEAGVMGVIHKATEGMSYIDDHYDQAKAGALAAGLLWGAYHFGNSSNVDSQIANFLHETGIDDKTLYALDWEDEPNGRTMSLPQARAFLTLLEQRTGRKGVLYSGNTAKQALGNTHDLFFGSHRLWLAQYTTNPTTQASWSAPWLWQYSDGVNGPQPRGCPGVSGEVDTNSWAGTDQELIDQWAGVKSAPTLPTVDITVESDISVAVRVHAGKNVVIE